MFHLEEFVCSVAGVMVTASHLLSLVVRGAVTRGEAAICPGPMISAQACTTAPIDAAMAMLATVFQQIFL